MKLHLQRYEDDGDTTIGVLSENGCMLCYTLEDQHQDVKVAGETRIPAGTYKVIPRTYGRFYETYKEKFGHEFAFEIGNVPNFTHILIHTGNNDDDTAGCVLVGMVRGENTIHGSYDAYKMLYDKIATCVKNGTCEIEISDELA